MGLVQPIHNGQGGANQQGQGSPSPSPQPRTIPYAASRVTRMPTEPESKPRRSVKEWLFGSPEDSYERGVYKDWFRAKRRVAQETLLHHAAVVTAQSATDAARALQQLANETDPDSLEGQVAEALAASDGHFVVESHQAMNTTQRERYLDDLARF